MRRLRTLVLACLLLAAAPVTPAASPGPAQEPGARELLERIERERDAVPHELFEQLGRRADREALEALLDGIELLEENRALWAAFEALRHFADDPRLAKRALSFLEDGLDHQLLARRWSAPRALVHFGPAGLALLERAALESRDPYLRERAVEQLLPELTRRADADALAVLFAGYGGSAEELRPVLAGLGGHGVERALTRGLAERAVPLERKLAIVTALGSAYEAEVDGALVKALGRDEPELVAACVAALEARGYDGHHARLKKLAARREPAVRYAALGALMRAPGAGSDGKWAERLYGDLTARDPAARRDALAAIVALREAASIPVLIERLAAEGDGPDSLAPALVDALRSLTGLDHGPSAERWSRWWEREGAGFAVPAADAAREAELERRREAWRRTVRYDFYGLEVTEGNVCFLLDASGSMRSTNGIGISRLEIAKRQLSDTVGALPEQRSGQPVRLNVIFFGTGLAPFAPDLVELTPGVRAELLAAIEAQGTLGLTAVFDGLERAFASTELDAIYLLSDGSPNGGRLEEPEEIRAEVRAWNAARETPIRIHCVAAGAERPLLRWLAEDSGGRYVEAPDD